MSIIDPIIHKPISSTPSGRISIGLAARDTHWAQYSFQFAHEFCHTLANFSNNPQRLMRSPPQVSFWLERVFAKRPLYSPCELRAALGGPPHPIPPGGIMLRG
jgi:hypothetical protein